MNCLFVINQVKKYLKSANKKIYSITGGQMKISKKSIIIIMFSLNVVFLYPVQQSNAGEAEDVALKMMEVTGSIKALQQMMGQLLQGILPLLKKAHPDVSDKDATIIVEELSAILDEEAPELINATIPIYTKYLTVEDMKAVIAFYKSPAGINFITLLPEMTLEGNIVGQEYFKTNIPSILKQLKQRLNERGMIFNL